jgi:EAL and modified HD-GYP domain-containing signal transduction protein
MKSQNCLIGRQPILCNNENIVAYELLFRSLGSANNAEVRDATFSSANVINNTLTNFGIKNLLGEHLGFINLDYELLMSDVLEILPRDQIVLELLESLDVTDKLVERCRELKRMGFTLALDDHEYNPIFHDLYNIADIVKIDLIQTPLEHVPDMVELLRPFPVKLLAEKVESRSEYLACRNMKFDYFQGYFFAKPSVLEKKRLAESGVTLIKLMRLLSDDADTSEIVENIKSDSSLTFKLLVMANSVAVGVRERVESVQRAISIVGRNQIKRWVQLSLFASDDIHTSANPLIDMAAVRAGLMEQLAKHNPYMSKDHEAPEKAFLTGILSLLERVYSISIDELTLKLNLSEEIRSALISREGFYGKLLTLSEKNESLDFDAVEALLEEMGISVEDASDSQVESYAWNSAQTLD